LEGVEHPFENKTDTEIVESLSILTEINKEELVVAVDLDEDATVIEILVFLNDEDSAYNVYTELNKCAGQNSNNDGTVRIKRLD